MNELYTNCETCGTTILRRTHKRHGGLCKSCYNTSPTQNGPRPEPMPQQRDTIEATPQYIAIVETVDEMATDAGIQRLRKRFPALDVDADNLPLGFCHLFWRHKQRILKEEHSIHWKTPAELNPHIRYD